MVQFGQKSCDRMAHKTAVTRPEKLSRSAIRHLDKAMLVNGDNGRPGFERQAAIPDHLGHEQTCAGKRQHLQSEADVTTCRIERTEHLAEHRAGCGERDNRPSRQNARHQKNGEKIQKAE